MVADGVGHGRAGSPHVDEFVFDGEKRIPLSIQSELSFTHAQTHQQQTPRGNERELWGTGGRGGEGEEARGEEGEKS